jgi:beta-N-acetylhexosaminidase
MPTLAETIAGTGDPHQRTVRVQNYATGQGRELKAAGINLNFAPVVDLNFHIVNARDFSTRIYTRAISDDPETVRSVAADYCASLRAAGIVCTLKHFPGLGRVSGDTHRETAMLHAPVEALEKADWIPFRALAESGAFIMVGHVQLDALDPERPASISQAVIARLRSFAQRTVLITDDFSMLAVYRSREGIGGGSVAALNAGIDLILISYDFDQFYPAMYALLQADQNGRLQRDTLAESARRLALTKPSDR